MDKFRIDNHKLIYHVKRVSDWLDGRSVYPIYIEIAPAGGCNHRCIYCALDFMEYKPRFLDTAILKKRLSEMARHGVKSIMYAGEGEPLLHKDIAEIINHTKKARLDVAVTTNGVLFDRKIIDKTLGDITWIKVSINGGTSQTYSMIHRSKPEDFDKVIANISYAVGVKKKNGYKTAIGMQLLLLPENANEVVTLTEKARQIGADYLVVKPYSQHPSSKTTKYKNIKYSDYAYLAEKLKSINNKDFNVIFRLNTMKKWDDGKRNYKHCLALPFWAYIDAGGGVWGCSAYLGDDKFLYGNINDTSFERIWQGEKRLKTLRWIESEHDTSVCRVNCRMDEVNRYLWELKNMPEHVNFI